MKRRREKWNVVHKTKRGAKSKRRWYFYTNDTHTLQSHTKCTSLTKYAISCQVEAQHFRGVRQRHDTITACHSCYWVQHFDSSFKKKNIFFSRTFKSISLPARFPYNRKVGKHNNMLCFNEKAYGEFSVKKKIQRVWLLASILQKKINLLIYCLRHYTFVRLYRKLIHKLYLISLHTGPPPQSYLVSEQCCLLVSVVQQTTLRRAFQSSRHQTQDTNTSFRRRHCVSDAGEQATAVCVTRYAAQMLAAVRLHSLSDRYWSWWAAQPLKRASWRA
jgi:hypothetical protein